MNALPSRLRSVVYGRARRAMESSALQPFQPLAFELRAALGRLEQRKPTAT